jgi:phosphatidylinositol kinase/protein kinase (PI-3  family)
MLRKDGGIVHIDFGFFLSNAPGIVFVKYFYLFLYFKGRGLEFEKKVPFKLISEYIDLLGGWDSNNFDRFRKLIFK